MRKFFTSLMFLASALTVSAMPVKPGMWQNITLADGTVVKAQRVGDEHLSFMRSAEGVNYTRVNGTWQVFTREAFEAKKAQIAKNRAARRKAISASTEDGLGEYGKSGLGGINSIGTVKIPVLMVEFDNLHFKSTTTVELMQKIYNGKNYKNDELGMVGSAHDYFVAQSGGMFVPEFEVVGKVTLSQGYEYYGKNDASGNDNIEPFIKEAINLAVEAGVDFSKFQDSKGNIQNISFLYAGKGEATEEESTANSKYIWPHEDEFESNENFNGFHFNSYFVGNELYTGGTALMGIGVFCHELGHALGLPDFYCTDYSYNENDPFSYWSIMDGGGYVRDGYAPVGYTAYEKSMMGWLKIKELTGEEEVTLSAENPAVLYRNPKNNKEYWIFENRVVGDWNPETFYDGSYKLSMGSGMMVSHITYNASAWDNDILNNTENKMRAHMVKADGAKLYYECYNKNLYGNGINKIAKLPLYSTTNGLAVSITDITKGDETVSFNFNPGTTSTGSETTDDNTGSTTVIPSGDYFFIETFDQCDGTGANDGNWATSVAGSKTTFNADNEWSATDAFGAYQSARFGSGKKAGSATTPAFTVTENTTLTFKAAKWGKDSNILTVTATGATLGETKFEMPGEEWGNFTTTLTPSSESASVTLNFAAAKRFFLDDVMVAKPVAAGINTVEHATMNNVRYNLSGQKVGTDYRGIVIMNGKKYIQK